MSLDDVLAASAVITLDRTSHAAFLVNAFSARKLTRSVTDTDRVSWPVFYCIAVHQCARFLFDAVDAAAATAAKAETAAHLSWSQTALLEQLKSRCPPVRALPCFVFAQLLWSLL